jgi:hypothetical protein
VLSADVRRRGEEFKARESVALADLAASKKKEADREAAYEARQAAIKAGRP